MVEAEEELRGDDGDATGLLERVGAGPTRSELQRLDWTIMTGRSGENIGSIQAATLRHADGTWLRLLQIGSAYDARRQRLASNRERASSAEQRTSNTAGAMDTAAGAADLGAAAVVASESAAQLAVALGCTAGFFAPGCVAARGELGKN